MNSLTKDDSIVLSVTPIDYEIVYVKQPNPQPPYNVKWKVRIGKQEFDYFTGLGHIKNYKNHDTLYKLNQVIFLLQTGKPRHGGDRFELVKPKLDDVVHCLIMDSDVLNYASFEDWCFDFGYNPDSISDKKVYDDCVSNALKLSSVLDIEKLKPLFIDY
jgi:hypothetical protein